MARDIPHVAPAPALRGAVGCARQPVVARGGCATRRCRRVAAVSDQPRGCGSGCGGEPAYAAHTVAATPWAGSEGESTPPRCVRGSSACVAGRRAAGPRVNTTGCGGVGASYPGVHWRASRRRARSHSHATLMAVAVAAVAVLALCAVPATALGGRTASARLRSARAAQTAGVVPAALGAAPHVGYGLSSPPVAPWVHLFPATGWDARYGLRSAVLNPPYANVSTLLIAGGGTGKEFTNDVWAYAASESGGLAAPAPPPSPATPVVSRLALRHGSPPPLPCPR